jgi:plastocyanin
MYARRLACTMLVVGCAVWLAGCAGSTPPVPSAGTRVATAPGPQAPAAAGAQTAASTPPSPARSAAPTPAPAPAPTPAAQPASATPTASTAPAAIPEKSAQASPPATAPAPQPQPSAAKTFQVDIRNIAFSPAALTVPVGSTVVWVNHDPVVHTVTALAGAPAHFDSGPLDPGASFRFTFPQPGTYSYYCIPHAYAMHGTVTVQ